MTTHQYRAILAAVSKSENSYKTQIIHLRGYRFRRDLHLIFVVYRVKISVASFLYCTPPLISQVSDCKTVLPTKQSRSRQAMAYRSTLRHSVDISNNNTRLYPCP